MNWYKKANKQPWQMDRYEYENMPMPEKKPRQRFEVKIGPQIVEVIRNPSYSDMRQMTKEVREVFLGMPYDEPALRSTQDINGNKYYWKAHEGVHTDIETLIMQRTGEELGRNLERPLYYYMLEEALKTGKKIPQRILNDFFRRYPGIARSYGVGDPNELV